MYSRCVDALFSCYKTKKEQADLQEPSSEKPLLARPQKLKPEYIELANGIAEDVAVYLESREKSSLSVESRVSLSQLVSKTRVNFQIYNNRVKTQEYKPVFEESLEQAEKICAEAQLLLEKSRRNRAEYRVSYDQHCHDQDFTLETSTTKPKR